MKAPLHKVFLTLIIHVGFYAIKNERTISCMYSVSVPTDLELKGTEFLQAQHGHEHLNKSKKTTLTATAVFKVAP